MIDRSMVGCFSVAVVAVLVAACGSASTVPAPPGSGVPQIRVLAPDNVTDAPRPVEGMHGMMSRLRYPDRAKAARVKGRVIIEFIVSETGATRGVEVARTSGSSTLDREAVRLVSETQFVPGRVDDTPVAVRMILPIMFRLR